MVIKTYYHSLIAYEQYCVHLEVLVEMPMPCCVNWCEERYDIAAASYGLLNYSSFFLIMAMTIFLFFLECHDTARILSTSKLRTKSATDFLHSTKRTCTFLHVALFVLTPATNRNENEEIKQQQELTKSNNMR